uniref:Uncharacterized protein n=1 Tax=Peronospora matthiolae TaxID=2874970 RepID=A0AAV1UF76_9STRA
MRARTLLAIFAFLSTATVCAIRPLDRQHSHHERKLVPALWGFGPTSCKCKSTPRPCLFIHGEGSEVEEEELQHGCKLFGDMDGHAPCCSSIKYTSLDTVNSGWTNETLQEKVCSHALSMSESSSVAKGTIKDTILVTHSMGALIVAGAVANGKCTIDSSTTWVSMSAPMNGTMASNYAQDRCSDDDMQAFNRVLTLIGSCPTGKATKSIAYMGGKYSSLELNKAFVAAQEVYRDHVSAVMCSIDNIGITSPSLLQYVFAGRTIDHGTDEHDGVVTYESCRGGLPASKFSNRPESKFYASKCNHDDTAFLNGDGFFDDALKPVQWFECLL